MEAKSRGRRPDPGERLDGVAVAEVPEDLRPAVQGWTIAQLAGAVAELVGSVGDLLFESTARSIASGAILSAARASGAHAELIRTARIPESTSNRDRRVYDAHRLAEDGKRRPVVVNIAKLGVTVEVQVREAWAGLTLSELRAMGSRLADKERGRETPEEEKPTPLDLLIGEAAACVDLGDLLERADVVERDAGSDPVVAARVVEVADMARRKALARLHERGAWAPARKLVLEGILADLARVPAYYPEGPERDAASAACRAAASDLTALREAPVLPEAEPGPVAAASTEEDARRVDELLGVSGDDIYDPLEGVDLYAPATPGAAEASHAARLAWHDAAPAVHEEVRDALLLAETMAPTRAAWVAERLGLGPAVERRIAEAMRRAGWTRWPRDRRLLVPVWSEEWPDGDEDEQEALCAERNPEWVLPPRR